MTRTHDELKAHKYFVISFDKIYFWLEDLFEYGQLRYSKRLK